MRAQVQLWAGPGLFLALAAFLAWFGWVYANVEQMLWFHAAAVPEAARGAIAPLYFGLMRLIGSLSLGLALATALVAVGPVLAGSRAAAIGLALALAIPFLGAALVAERLAAETGAPTSWNLMGALLAVDALALLASLAPKPRLTAAPAPARPR